MQRRSFLKYLIGGLAVTAVERTFPFRVYSFASAVKPVQLVTPAVLGEYADYCNFSSFAITASIDDLLKDTAVEMSYRAGLSIEQLAALPNASPNFKFFQNSFQN